MVDAVEKKGLGIRLTRSNRIMRVDFLNELALSIFILNQYCLEISKIFFRHHQPNSDVASYTRFPMERSAPIIGDHNST